MVERVIKVLRRSNGALFSPLAEGEWRVEYKPGVICEGPMGSLLYAFADTKSGRVSAALFLDALSIGIEGDDVPSYEIWECEAEVVRAVPRRALVVDEYGALFLCFWKTFEKALRDGEDPVSVLDQQSGLFVISLRYGAVGLSPCNQFGRKLPTAVII